VGIEPDSAKLFALNPSTGAVLYSTSLGSAGISAPRRPTDGFVVSRAGNHVMAFSRVARPLAGPSFLQAGPSPNRHAAGTVGRFENSDNPGC